MGANVFLLCYHSRVCVADRRDPLLGTPRTLIALVVAMFLIAACDPFVARVKGGNNGLSDWEIGVKF